MAEYIDKGALRDAVESIDWYSVHRGKLTVGATSGENALYKANDIYSTIDNIQAADVAPIRQGRWIPAVHVGDCCYHCSECQFLRDAYLIEIGNYCPNCGAKMAEKEVERN